MGVDDCVGDGVADAVGLGVLEGDGVIEALGEGDGEAEGEGLGVVPPPPRLGSGTPLTGVNKPTNKVMDRAAPII